MTIRWTDKDNKSDYNRLVYFLSRLQHKVYDKKYNSYSKFKLSFWHFIGGVIFKLKMYFWHRGINE